MAYVLFAGQSNMGGIIKDGSTAPPEWKPDPLTFIFNDAANRWETLQSSVNTTFSSYVGYWGPEVQFAVDFRRTHADEPLYIVKDAHGGTTLGAGEGPDWSPGSRGENFDEVTSLLDRAGVTLGGARPDAMFWGQGETDGDNSALAEAYGANLAAFFAAARSQWLADGSGKIGFFQISASPPYSGAVRAGQSQVDAADPNATSFSTLDLPTSDNLHYTSQGLVAVGDRFYALYEAWRAAGLDVSLPVAGSILVPMAGGALQAGAGAETFVFNPEPWQPVTVDGFTVGQDHIDLSGLLRKIGYAGSDPVADKYITLASDGAGGTQVLFDHDGAGSGMTWSSTLLTLRGVPVQNVSWSALTGSGGPAQGQTNGTAGPDLLVAQDGGSRLFGGAGDDTLQGGAGQDYLRGEDGNDTIYGGAGFDDIQGNKGDDVERGGLGDDWVVGGQGNDSLSGEEGRDIVLGNLGNDWLDGGSEADTVRGGQGDDIIYGSDGDDWLSGDRGADTLTGGSGADIFHSFTGAGVDRVTDFHVSEGDRVQLDPGTSYSVSQQGGDTVVQLGGADDRLVLVGVQASSLSSGWVFVA